MRFVLVVAACGLMLGGCKTASEERAAIALEDQATCARLGAAPGTDRDFQCKLMLETQRRNADAAHDAASHAVAQQNAQAYGRQLMFGRQ